MRSTGTIGRPLLAALAAVIGIRAQEPAFVFVKPGTTPWYLGELWIRDAAGERRLTEGGPDGLPAVSPDGRHVAYVAKRGETRGELMVLALAGGAPRLLAEMMAPQAPAWSPDGRRLAYAGWVHGDPSDIYVLELDGDAAPQGPPRRVTHHSGRSPAWSPDGKRIAYMAFGGDDEHDGLCVVSADGAEHRKLADSPARDHRPAWAPDGTRIAYQWYESTADDRLRGEVRVIAISGGTPRSVGPGPSTWGAAWSPDDRMIASCAAGDGKRWLCISTPDGTDNVGHETPSDLDVGSLQWTADGRHLICTSGREGRFEIRMFESIVPSRIFRLSSPSGITIRRLAEGRDPALIPPPARGSQTDRHVSSAPLHSALSHEPAFVFVEPGPEFKDLGEIWIRDATGERRLTAGGPDGLPAVSPDGRSVAYFARRGKSRGELMLLSPDGRPPRLLAEDVAPQPPAWSPDGRRLAFAGFRHGDPPDIHVLDLPTPAEPSPAPRRVTTHSGRSPAWSPDGRRIAFMAYVSDGEHDGLCVVATDGTAPRRLTDSAARDHRPAWSPDGRSIAYTWCESLPDGMRGEVRVIPAEGGAPRRVSPEGASAWGAAWSPDGGRIAFVVGNRGRRIVATAASDGSGLRTHAGATLLDDTTIQWTADGTAIVYGTVASPECGVWKAVAAIDAAPDPDRKPPDGMKLVRGRDPAVIPAMKISAENAGPPSPRPRAMDLGIPFDGAPGPLNAITDVAGVEVGHATLISGSGKLEVGKGPVRTGVTAVCPRGARSSDPVSAGWWSLNGNGEMTGTTWIEESGFLEGPVMITNTHSVGVVRDAVIRWRVERLGPDPSGWWWSLPVVAETYDGWLNDINGFHVKPEHVFQALDAAKGGPVAEGSVGGGTGMICHEFKGGIGTASRKLAEGAGGFLVGALVQANYGARSQLRIAGVPVGAALPVERAKKEGGSIIVVVATDAPLVAHQCKRLARRASLALGRMGSAAGDGSGDIFVAFSTANPGAAFADDVATVRVLPNARMDPLFAATVQSVEEAIVNALVAADTMTGIDDHVVPGLPLDRVREILRAHGRLAEKR